MDVKGRRRWDAPVVAVKPAYETLAVAAGEEGLWELPAFAFRGRRSPFVKNAPPRRVQRIKGHVSDCHWLYYSVLGSSHLRAGAVAAYRREQGSDSEREWVGEIEVDEIFGHTDNAVGYLWGAQDKVYWAREGQVAGAKYRPGRWQRSGWFEEVGEVARLDEEVVSASTALFGAIVETSDDLLVFTSDGNLERVGEEPVAWRAYPRSLRYLNQLHVVLEDRLEILAFTDDFFVDQDDKQLGIRFTEREPRQQRR